MLRTRRSIAGRNIFLSKSLPGNDSCATHKPVDGMQREIVIRAGFFEPSFSKAFRYSSTDFFPIEQLQMKRLSGDHWEMFGTGTFHVIEEPRLARLLHQRLSDDGRLVADGPPAEIATPELIAEHYGAEVRVVGEGGSLAVIPVRRK